LRTLYRALAITPIAFFSVLASAQVAFNDFVSDSDSATYGYDQSTGWTVSGTGAGPGEFESANKFTAGASGVISNLIIPITLVGGTNTFTVEIVNDNSNAVGSTVIESWSANSVGSFGSWSAPDTLAGNGTGSLVSGTAYWIEVVANPLSSNGYGVFNWSGNDSGVGGTAGTDAYNTGTGWNYQSSTLGAFEINVQPAPEPFTVVGLAVGSLALLRRRKKA